MANDNSLVTISEEKFESKYTSEINKSTIKDPSCQFETDKKWLNCQYHDIECTSIKKPDEIENEMLDPSINYSEEILDRIQGSMIGMALGDALGAHVEFRPRDYLREHPVSDFQGGGTWGLNKGQFTDDTSMALCLANSLIARQEFNGYDQLVRYKWWYKHGYMSSTGQCFDIGSATSQSLNQFIDRQKKFSKENNIPFEQLDFLSDVELLKKFDVYCSEEGVAGNGALMRLTPVPLFFYKNPLQAVELSGISGKITHGDQKAYDACRYYGALIVAALHGENKEKLLDENFYLDHIEWFNGIPLHADIMNIIQGSFKKKGGYDEGIRGKGYIVAALEAALWAFWSDDNSFKKGAIDAVNLGDDTDTTAAIYGQLAGAFYGYKNLPFEWVEQVYAKKFINTLSKWIAYHTQKTHEEQICSPSITIKSKSKIKNDNIHIPSPIKKTDSPSATIHIEAKNNNDNILTPLPTIQICPSTIQSRNNHNDVSTLSPTKQTDSRRVTTTFQSKINDNNIPTSPPTEQTYSSSIKTNPRLQNTGDNIPTSPPVTQTYSKLVATTTRPENNYHNTSTLSQTSNLNTHTTHRGNSRSNISSTHYDKISENKSSHEALSYEYNHIPHSFSNTEQLSSVPKLSESKSSHEASSYSYNHIPQSFSNTEQLSSVPKLSEMKKTVTTEHTTESTAYNASYLQESNSNYSSTNKTSDLDRKELVQWTAEDVGRWIQSFGGNYAPYIDSFKKDKVDGYRLYRCINDQILINYGINNEAHRQKILDSIQQLKIKFINKN